MVSNGQQPPTVQVKCRVTPDELALLDALGQATRRSRSQLLRLGVDKLLSEPLVLPAKPVRQEVAP